MSKRFSKVAVALVRSGALKFGSFRVKSGIVSPYYIDLTWLLSSPEDFRRVVDAVAEKIEEIVTSERVDKLASIELKGALLLPSIANKLNLPCVVVRKEEKKYGVTGRIAGGEVKNGEYVLFFDDVVTDAGSKLEGIKLLEQHGAKVKTLLVVVDREQGGKERLERLGYKLRSLTTISEMVNILLCSAYLSKKQAKTVLDYIKSAQKING